MIANSSKLPVILLVDDEPRNLFALEAILEGEPVRLVKATSGRQALELALREMPTVVLLDVLMPGMDGFEVAKTLKGVAQTREIPIVFLTALATDVRHIYRAYDVGALDYLIKPLDAEVVRRKVAVLVDLVQQRKEIERQARALREAERREHAIRLAEMRIANDRRYRKLVEGIDHAIGWTMDAENRFSFISRRASDVLGHPAEVITTPGFWTQQTHPDDLEDVLSMFERARAEGLELACNHRLRHADGRTLWFRTSVSADTDLEGAVELHGISVDVTDIKRAHEDAERAMRFRDDLVAIVAHDLRNPLNTIVSCSELLELTSHETADPRAMKSARAIGLAADHMQRIIADLLDFALIQAERLTIDPQPLPARSLIGESLAMFEPIAKSRDLELVGTAPRELVVAADRHRLLQILSNLVGNAMKFTPDGGRVRVTAEHSGADATFSIADTGPGMSAADSMRMWQRYWRAERSEAAGARTGLGLGLSIAEGLVTAHGGRIWAKSAIGEGTTLFFTIPLARAEVVEPGPAASSV